MNMNSNMVPMNGLMKETRMSKRGGQTLIIALIILGILLILGFTFLGYIGNNIQNTGRFKNRSIADGLAEAGIKYAHTQLASSPIGADWRGAPTLPIPAPGQPNFTSDPDAMYLRPPAVDASGNPLSFRSDDPTAVDLGGPDGLGFYTRVNFSNGRALVRVRYAPSDANIFSSSPSGSLINPGKARNYIIVEAVGRPGTINVNDPTSTLNGNTPIQFQGFPDSATLQTAIAAMKAADTKVTTSRKEIAFVPLGVTETALFITNKDRLNQPADIGIPADFGAVTPIAEGTLGEQFGNQQQLFNFGTPPTPTLGQIGVGGSIFSNADLRINGLVSLNLNATLGDTVSVSGSITPADQNSVLQINRAEYFGNRPGYPAGWYGGYPATSSIGTTVNLTGPAMDSRNPGFNTFGAIVRDGVDSTDAAGYPRSVGRKDPPLIDATDPNTGELRYLVITKDSGAVLNGQNTGRYGQGSGIYVDNSDDYQLPEDAISRLITGANTSLVHDWLNPNNGTDFNTGWHGYFYAPVASSVQLFSGGFYITRDNPRGNNTGHWTAADGTATNYSTLEYRVGRGSDGLVHIVNTLTPGIGNINGAVNYNLGPIFNGVLYFEGNVRVRGVIPTDVQMTIVSKHTVYVDGSITKGVVGNDVAKDKAAGALLDRPTRSQLMLMAREYVAVNTTQFFGPGNSPVSVPQETSSDPYDPVQFQPGPGQVSGVDLKAEFLLNPNPVATTTPATNPNVPSSWQPYATSYFAPGTTTLVPTQILISHAYDGTTGSSTFVSMQINPGLPFSPYLFPLTGTNAATPLLGGAYIEPGYTQAGYASVYGVGAQNFQIFPTFESIGFPLVTTNMSYTPGTTTMTGTVNNGPGRYTLLFNDTNDISLALNQSFNSSASQNYDLGRFSIVPDDIRIEASVYAENGSFFVIPGYYFNPNPNDSRVNYQNLIAQYQAQGQTLAAATQLADNYRLTNYGSFPAAPFYGEPLDVKVAVDGSVSENMPPNAAQQAEYLRKWGWIPTQFGASGQSIPAQHIDPLTSGLAYTGNFSISYDPVLATGRSTGFSATNSTASNPYIRTDSYGRPLPPMPCLPVSPTIVYYGEVDGK